MTGPGHRAGQADVIAELALQLGFVRRFALSCGVRPQLVSDFVQDVAVTALKRIQEGAFMPSPDLPLRDAMRAWLTGIVRFMAIDQWRGMKIRRRIMLSGPTREHPIDVDAHLAPSPEAQLDAREELRRIERVHMSPVQRAVVRLTALGYTAEQVGQMLGFSANTASTHLTRARKAYEKAKGKRG